ncbi:unnamed protein product [Cuscuta campestris]|uniref:Pectinesterase inhibitor domain-containing protein n=1 Tax=Cuscuta campestris TaxID=132261 RepID=A0A484N8K1_9ASTE|nr:unnamed protein product [Cuscuta campestris]
MSRCMIMYVSLTSLLLIAADAATPSDFCATAVDKKLCEETVKGTMDWNHAIIKALQAAMSQLDKVDDGQVKATVHKSKSASMASTIDKICTEAYTNTHDRLYESLRLVRNGEKTGSLNFKLSAALTSLEDCTNAFSDFNLDMSGVEALNSNVENAIRVCLAVEKYNSSGRHHEYKHQ